MTEVHEPSMFSEVVRELKAGKEIPYSEDCTHVTKDRLESSGEQMYRLSQTVGRFTKYEVQGGLVGEDCELVLSDQFLEIGKEVELHGTTEVYDQSCVVGTSIITDSLIKGSSYVNDAVVTQATVDQSVISAGSFVHDAFLKNVKVGPHVTIHGNASATTLALENVDIPGFVVIDRPGQVHQLPHPQRGYLNWVAIDTRGEKVLGGQFFIPIRGIKDICEYLEKYSHHSLSDKQVQENIDFVHSLTLPEKP
nr:MAG TPA: hypothetical protein [Caudoviricetes sp.]